MQYTLLFKLLNQSPPLAGTGELALEEVFSYSEAKHFPTKSYTQRRLKNERNCQLVPMSGFRVFFVRERITVKPSCLFLLHPMSFLMHLSP